MKARSKSDFEFFVPFEIDVEKSDASDKGERRIRGYASNSFKDRQDESILQSGLDISNFVNHGWFNYDHDNSIILGYPDKSKTKIDSKGLYVEGTLLRGVDIADRMWETAVALQKSNAPRRLGFSVEGKILQKSETGKILKALIYNCAITANPVNPTATWEAVIKSFTEDNFDISKACEAGYEFNMDEENNGSCLKRESLDTSLKALSTLCDDSDEAKEKRNLLKDQLLINKSLSVNEAILFLQVSSGISRQDARNIVFKYENEK